MKTRALLVVQNHQSLRRDVKSLLLHHGFEVFEPPNQTQALESFKHRQAEIVICESASQTTRMQPIPSQEHFSEIADSNSASTEIEELIGGSSTMQNIRKYVGKVALSDSNVLITGETGTGKELVAQLVHKTSRRRQKPFVCINCAAIPETLLESELFGHERGAFTGASSSYEGKLKVANGGTVFFDEIGEMGVHGQAKLLRVIEEREVTALGARKTTPVDIRIIAATNQNLEQGMSEQKFRQDLYYRLNVARIHLPPLRDRKEDIGSLLNHYISEFNSRTGHDVNDVTKDTLAFLLNYDWPGNVRELKNLIEAIFIDLHSETISPLDFPEQFRKLLKADEDSPPDERSRLLTTLFATDWNKSKTAERLHWSRMTVYRKMAQYHIVKSGVM